MPKRSKIKYRNIMSKNSIRKIFQSAGLDLHRYHPELDRLAWLRGLGMKTVFDIGANVGQFATEIRAELPEAQIYSFEPIKECYDKLVTNFRKDTRFRAFNFALGEKEESMAMNKSAYTPSSSLLPMADPHKELFPHTAKSAPEQIKIRRLDDVLAELEPVAEPFLVKMDTQGYESKVITGGLETLKKASAVLTEASFVELYEGQPLFDDIYEKLKALGFTYKGALHQKLDRKTGEVIFEDSIFVR